MYPMQGPASAHESDSPGYAEESERFSSEVVTWLIRLWAAAWIIGLLWTLWESEVTRLRLLHSATRTLHIIARAIGSLAIVTEQNYNELAESLH